MNVKHCSNNDGEEVIKTFDTEVSLSETFITANAAWSAQGLNLELHSEKLALGHRYYLLLLSSKYPKLMRDTSLTTKYEFLQA
jgi:hypothetical protein